MKHALVISIILTGIFASLGFAQSTAASQQKATPLEKYLNPDGTINTKSGFRGSLDPRGYQMTTAPNGEPRFIKPGKVSSTDIAFENSEWDPIFSPPGTNGSVYSIYVDSYNACVYIGGWFTKVGNLDANNVAVWRGNRWYPLGSGTNGQVNAIQGYAEGLSSYIVFGGSISIAGGIAVNNIAKWDPWYKTWSALGTGVNGPVAALADQVGSNLYVGGNFTTAGGVTVNNIARYNGSWHQMNNGANIGTDGSVLALYVDGGTVYAGGLFTTAGGVTVNGIAKWSSSTWSALGAGLYGGYLGTSAKAIIKVGSSIYVGGDFSSAGGVTASKIARWDGVSWYSIGGDFTEDYDAVYALATDGTNLYAGGSLKTIPDQNNVFRWDGTNWHSLGGVYYWDNINALAVYNQLYEYPEQFIPNNTLCVGGSFEYAGGLKSQGFATYYNNKWSASGQGLDDGIIYALASAGNDVYAGGEFYYAGGLRVASIAKWNGTSWDSLGSGINGSVYTIAIAGSDVYVGGEFDTAGSVRAVGIAKWDGIGWSALPGWKDDPVFSLAVDGTDLYVGELGVSKWDGSSWSALGSGMNYPVLALAIIGTDLYAGGDFTTAGGVSANKVAKWDGSSWSALSTGINGSVKALAVMGTDLYAGGDFTTAGGVSAPIIAKWDGSFWSSLGDTPNDYVNTLVVSGTDLYAGGMFSQAGGNDASMVARWDGITWSPLGDGVVDEVLALTSNRGAIYAGGFFPMAGGKPSFMIARWGLPYKPGGMIAGRIFIDANMNGMYDTGEEGASYGTILISRADNPFDFVSCATDANGYYHLDEVEDGEYIVACGPTTVEKITYPPTADHSYHVSITDGYASLDNDFGLFNLEVAKYLLMGDAHDDLGKQDDMVLTNTPFLDPVGISSDGSYITTDASTPLLAGFNYNSFSIFAEFSISEYPPAGGMPVFMGGLSSRWIGFYIQSDGTVGMKYNNSSMEGSSVICTLNDPHQALVTFDSASGIGRFYLDGILAGSANFTLSYAPGDKLISITDYSTGKTFKGNLYTLYVANADISSWVVEDPVSIINGTVYNDLNGNGSQDPGESGLAGWSVHLRTGDPVYDRDTTTDVNGHYTFITDRTWLFKITETTPDDWVQTFPPLPGEHIIYIADYRTISGIDFGNKVGYRYVGPVGGNWSTPSNWSGGHVPQPDEIVVIPVDVSVDALPNDSIMGLRILSGATLTFSTSAPPLKISGNVKIGGGGAVVFPTLTAFEKSHTVSAGSIGMICYQNWENLGTFTPGSSTITFAGDSSKSIGATNFYNLEISGSNTTTDGNLGITNLLMLHQTFGVSPNDTVIVTNTAVNAIQDTGRIIGSLKRHIASGATDDYRFESPLSIMKFKGAGTNPTAVTMTARPNTLPSSFNLDWQLVGGTADPVQNIVTYDSVKHFSKWVFGIPRPSSIIDPANIFSIDGTPADIDQEMGTGIPVINRIYTIDAEGGSDYEAELSLHYDQSEVPSGTSEADLKLLRGPYYADSVHAGWNIVSLSLIPASLKVDSLFPESISNAFAYIGTYVEKTELKYGEGYWLKFPGTQEIVMTGDDRDNLTLDVNEGWNLIGTISYPITAASVMSAPSDIIISDFFGYSTSYQPVDSLKPMHSYWVKVSSSGKLILSIDGIVPLDKKNPIRDEITKFNSLTFSDAAGNTQKLYFSNGKNTSTNNFELPPPPPSGVFDVRYSNGKYLAFPDGRANEYAIQISAADYPVSVAWDVKNTSQGSLLFADGNFIKMGNSGSVRIYDPNTVIKIKLTSDVSEGIPKEFALQQNYPNPFNPTTTIKYDLPLNSRVTISIYNILGQEVARLVDEEQSAGYKSVDWNAASFASGIYFYRISTQSGNRSFTDVKKMMLLK